MTGIAERPRLSPLTAHQLTRLRAQLDSDRVETERLVGSIEVEVGAIVDAQRDTATDDEHDPEGPTLAFERSQSSAILSQSLRHLGEIEAALLRIAEGTYGLCATCARPITLRRLQARPQATLCIRCAERVR